MASKKIIAVCQSKGEFVKEKDGTLSYNGGEAYAIDIDQNTQLNYFKKEVSEMFDYGDLDKMAIKYLLPGNKKTLITVSKDKDLARMVTFLQDSDTIDVFINPDFTHHAPNLSPVPASRSSRTTVAETVTQDLLPFSDAVMENMLDKGPVDGELPDLTTLHGSTNSSNGKRHHKAAQQWENAITGVDQRFDSFEQLRETIHRYSIANGFAYKYKKRDGCRVTAKCKYEGCKWQIYASLLKGTQLVCIKKMVDEHTCEGDALKAGCRASHAWVGSFISEKLKSSSNYRPKDIVDDIKKEFGIHLNYSQAYRAKEIAQEHRLSSYKEAYGQLPLLCKRITEINPGSVASFSIKEESTFRRLFISFYSSITGFQQGCRPLIFLDSAPLNSKYQAEIFLASSADGDDGVFTLAFAIVDNESADNWEWFMEELKSALSLSQPITFVADFQNGFNNILTKVFSNCSHSHCLRYMVEKLNKDLKGKLSHEAMRLVVNDFFAAAYATKPEEFESCIYKIKAISHEAYDWILNSEPKQWANSSFPGTRYNLLTSNYGQIFFDWVSSTGELPITKLIQFLQGKLMDIINTRRMESNQWETRLTPSKQEKLEQEILKAQCLRIRQSHGCMFEVHGDSLHVVDIDNWTCSCKQWQLTGLPCCHSISVILYIDQDPYDYCSKYFTAEFYRLTYAKSIELVSDIENLCESDGDQVSVTIKPPPTRHGKSRSTEPVNLMRRQMQCSKCKGLGHNKKSCKAS
ncbi:hypothetical protein KSS87_010647 [Heliosperma pusillum]|nr:hypothetical protein KSS87_010647 [Heliosperma pusillum]